VPAPWCRGRRSVVLDGVRAVVYRLRRLLRSQWRSMLGLCLTVAAAGGAVLALAVGAERTASAPDRYISASEIRYDGEVEQEAGAPRTAEVAALPGVAVVEPFTFVFGGLSRADGSPAPDALVFAGSHRAFGLRIVEGREPDPARPDEFVGTRSFAAGGDVAVGDRFRLATISQEQADRSGYEAFFKEDPEGPSLDAVLVGIADGPVQINDPTPLVVMPPSLIDRGAGIASTHMSVRLRPGTDLDAFRARLDTLPGGDALRLRPEQLISPEVRAAVDGQAQGFWVLTAVGMAAAVVVLGQLLTRNARLSVEEAPRLEAIGFTKGQRLAESMGRAAVPVLAGAVLGVAVAVAVSPVFPTGFVRRIEPHPGLRANVPVLAAATVALVLALLVWTAGALLLARRSGAERPSPIVERIAGRLPSATLVTGLRFAFTGTGRDRGSVRTSVAGMITTVVLFVGAVVFGSSLDRLVRNADRYGYTWDLYSGSGGEAVPEEARATLEADPDIDGLMLFGTGRARVGGETLSLAGMEAVKGDLAPRVLEGRIPSSADETPLAPPTARTLDVGVGDDLTVDAGGQSLQFRVTGLAVVPSVEGLDGVGQDAVVTMDGLRRLDAHAVPVAAGIRLRPGAPSGKAEELGLGQADPPLVIVNLARLRSIPLFLAGLVALLAMLTVVHVMLTSVRNRRRDVAVLRSLGADRRWVSRAVHWQATTFSLVPLAIGVPLGLSVGRGVFDGFVDRVGAVPDASFPFLLLTMVLAGFLLLANAVAALPAWRARRLKPAPLLTPE
jgi:hypothetical protein